MGKMLIGLIAGVLVLGAIVVFHPGVRSEVESIIWGSPVISNATAPTRDRVSDIGNKVQGAMGVPEDTPAQNAPAADAEDPASFEDSADAEAQ